MSTETETEVTPKQAIIAWAEKHGVTMRAEFVPFSQSRNKGEKNPSLNWRVTIKKRRASAGKWVDGDEMTVLTTDYSAGCAHCPSYKQQLGKRTMEDVERDERVKFECETGVKARLANYGRTIQCSINGGKTSPIMPELDAVLWSLSMDYGILDEGGFEPWAQSFGYDTDSRKAEAMYRACLDIAVALRHAFGDAAMAELTEAGQDY